MLRLLELSGGSLPLNCVPAEYQKLFGRPLYVSEYGAYKLVNLFKKLGDSMAVEGKGQRKFVYLRNWKAGPSAILARKEIRGKGNQEQSMNAGGVPADEFSDYESVVVEKNDEGRNHGKSEIHDQNLRELKHELQEILVSYSCWIFFGCFEEIYQQRYKRRLDCRRFGVDQLEDLSNKLRCGCLA